MPAGLAAAATADEIALLVDQAKSKNLSSHRRWLTLLHYDTTGNESDVKSADFFSSPIGHIDPEAELESVLYAFFEEKFQNPNTHAQCTFIARYRWLRKMLDWSQLAPPNLHCSNFQKFSHNNQIDSISMVYASGYMSNPASFYGHPFLKFNSSGLTGDSELLDTVVSYGAIIPDDENGLFYVLNGLFGGYVGRFADLQFYSFNHVYGENDLRDLWEYVLDLSKEETEFIVSYTWEVLGKDFIYYFLKDNCALRMAEIIEFTINEPLLPARLPWAMPSTMFDYMIKIKRNGKPLVKKVKWIPSRQTRFHSKFKKLNPEQAKFVLKFSEGKESFVNAFYSNQQNDEKTKLLDALIDYYEYLIINDRGDKELYHRKRAVLIERSALDVSKYDDKFVSPQDDLIDPPHKGPLPLMLQVGWYDNDVIDNGLRLRFRPAFFDHMSLDEGRIPNSTLSMMDTVLFASNGRVRIRKVDFVYLENLNLAKTPLSGDGGIAWDFKLAYETRNLSCDDCQVYSITGGFGKAYSISKSTTFFMMLDFFAETEYVESENFGYKPRIGLIKNIVNGWKTNIIVGKKTYFDGAESSAEMIQWDNRFGVDRKWDIRLSFQKHIAKEYTLAASFYW